ncbi:hypothetical protein FC99_GL002151 [Levilactobacillus koreensis JCM 16448]|uniref:hypothetical protein n=1 Tax=Levilactobacillus koreensis TaxID=637971 RepID=UPI0006EEE6B0|nr:hypothetical protein [Levilactobacillus koreensis]KRK85880.1 hypothetical protein FC99_GL002151 [Levilactobacillus koreensis JCM 16448]
MMKKVAMIAAAAAMVLPLGLGAIAPANTGVTAFAATKAAAKKTTYTLVSSKAVKKAAYHVKSGKPELFSAMFAADKSMVSLTKKGTLAGEKTYYATKKIVVKTKATKTAKAKNETLVLVKNGKTSGWVKLSKLTAGKFMAADGKKVAVKAADVAKAGTKVTAAAKKATAKKVTAKKTVAKKAVAKKTVAKTAVAKKATPKKTTAKKATTKKATAKKVAAKGTTFTLAKSVKIKKTAFHFKGTKPAYFTGKFAADQPKVTLTKKGTLAAGKTYYATKKITVKQGKKNVQYLFVTNKGWVLASKLVAGKF